MENREIMSDVGLFIVGGGPGDPNLITLKGYQTLQRAEVILYDNLINKTKQKYCKTCQGAERLFANRITAKRIQNRTVHNSGFRSCFL